MRCAPRERVRLTPAAQRRGADVYVYVYVYVAVWLCAACGRETEARWGHCLGAKPSAVLAQEARVRVCATAHWLSRVCFTGVLRRDAYGRRRQCAQAAAAAAAGGAQAQAAAVPSSSSGAVATLAGGGDG
jgi:hypothetical protein